MTPQMQQSIQLLQLNTIELEQLAEQELLENPFLSIEDESPDNPEPEPSKDAPAEAAEATTPDLEPAETPEPASAAESALERELDKTSDNNEILDKPSSSTPSEGEILTEDPSVTPPEMEAVPEQFDQVDLNWDDYYSDSENATYSGNGREDAEEHDFTEYTPSKTSLGEQLQWQLRCSSLDGQQAEIGEYLIGSLDEDGYLEPMVVQETAEAFNVEPAVVEHVLSVIQELDPVGIAARTLPECLLLQMKNLGSYSDLARVVLEEHMVEFQKKKFRDLGRKLKVNEADLLELFKKVSRLEPHPGRSMSKDSVQYISPDVYVMNIDGELMIYLHEGQTGRLSVDRFYQRLMRQQAKALTQQEREYALEKYRSALTLIKNIEKRKSTILRVTEAIMEVQRPFLDKGIEALKPLTLREVADMVGMHESTVARVTSRKYADTPQGLFALKYFFSSAIDSHGADAVSSRSIKDKLHQIIDNENPKKPFSDQKIAEQLNASGFDIARRTVAKYREQLKILPAKYRRQS